MLAYITGPALVSFAMSAFPEVGIQHRADGFHHSVPLHVSNRSFGAVQKRVDLSIRSVRRHGAAHNGRSRMSGLNCDCQRRSLCSTSSRFKRRCRWILFTGDSRSILPTAMCLAKYLACSHTPDLVYCRCRMSPQICQSTSDSLGGFNHAHTPDIALRPA